MKIAALVRWSGDGDLFKTGKYPRLHQWEFDGGTIVPASSSPSIVPVPLSDPSGVDPEEALVAAVSSCHMLWFLSLAAKKGFAIQGYEDNPEGSIGKIDDQVCLKKVTLSPKVDWYDCSPSQDEIQELHDIAHQKCFVANSLKAEITIQST